MPRYGKHNPLDPEPRGPSEVAQAAKVIADDATEARL
jgi:hypothetical protein